MSREKTSLVFRRGKNQAKQRSYGRDESAPAQDWGGEEETAPYTTKGEVAVAAAMGATGSDPSFALALGDNLCENQPPHGPAGIASTS